MSDEQKIADRAALAEIDRQAVEGDAGPATRGETMGALPAFPHAAGPEDDVAEGLATRELFAGLALVGLVAAGCPVTILEQKREAAGRAVGLADALLEALYAD